MSFGTLKIYFDEARTIAARIDLTVVDAMVERLARLKRVEHHPARLFVCGTGGSAANASHAVNDFRKICGIEAYAPTDNVAELTARINDDGWDTVFSEWLKVSRLCGGDMVMVLSVGGGGHSVSSNILYAVHYARVKKARIVGIVGSDGGSTAAFAHVCVVIPAAETPYIEAFQAV